MATKAQMQKEIDRLNYELREAVNRNIRSGDEMSDAKKVADALHGDIARRDSEIEVLRRAITWHEGYRVRVTEEAPDLAADDRPRFEQVPVEGPDAMVSVPSVNDLLGPQQGSTLNIDNNSHFRFGADGKWHAE